MADVQKQFEEFHKGIRVDYDMKAGLQEKRDIVVEKIKKYLSEKKLPGFRVLLQGSYAMGTGVKPIADLEYDIDIGLRFDFKPGEYTASTVRGWIFEAVKNHTLNCESKGPCVRVSYEAGYHLDLVAYCTWDESGQTQFRLAHKTRGWVEADPPKLMAHVLGCRKSFEGTEDSATGTDQLRRCVRYLKRWGDERKPSEDDQKPTGIGYVLLCCALLQRTTSLDLRPDDRSALLKLSRSLAGLVGRITAVKPTPEYDDVLARITDAKMAGLKLDLGKLADALEQAGEEADPVKASKLLQKHFGDDFPVPEPEDTGSKTKAPAILTSSSSA